MESPSPRSSCDEPWEHKEQEDVGLISPQKPSQIAFLFTLSRISVWLVTLIFFIVLSLVAATAIRLQRQESYETGFQTDFEAVRSKIALVQYTFTGGIKLGNDNQTFYREISPGPQYVGPPSMKIDLAWNKLLQGLNFDISHEQAMHLQEETYRWPSDNRFFLGLDVFHSLHCLNIIRQALRSDYYHHVFEKEGEPKREDHIDHCIDHLRQSLMCHADLTPMSWEERGNKLILKNTAVHTCRDFQRLQDFVLEATEHIDVHEKEEIVSGDLYVVD